MNDSQFDELLQKIIPIACYEECCQLEQAMLLEGEHTFSKNFEKKMKILLKKQKRSKKQQANLQRRTRLKPRYLLVAILLFILSSITVLACEPIRESLRHMIYTIYDEYILLEKEEKNEADTLKENNVSHSIVLLRPTYIPDGYELEEELIDKKSISLLWVDSSDHILAYEQMYMDGNRVYLSSDGKEPASIHIGDIDGKLIMEEDGMHTIFYEKNNYLFVLSGTLPADELIQILTSIEEKK